MSDLIQDQKTLEEEAELAAAVAAEEEMNAFPIPGKKPPVKISDEMIKWIEGERGLRGPHGARLDTLASRCGLIWENTWQGRRNASPEEIGAGAAILRRYLEDVNKQRGKSGQPPIPVEPELKARLKKWIAARRGAYLIPRPQTWHDELRDSRPERMRLFSKLVFDHLVAKYGPARFNPVGEIVGIGSLSVDVKSQRITMSASSLEALAADGKK